MIVIEHKQGLFKLAYTDDENMVLTNWNEGDPISEFSASDKMYIPEKWDDLRIRETYHEIEKVRANEIEELQREEAENDVKRIKEKS